MANISKIREVFEGYLQDYWSKTRIAWENVPFQSPEKYDWIKPALLINDTQNVNIGSYIHSRVRHTGLYTIQLFSPLNQGTGTHNRLADDLIKLFQNKELYPNILTYASTVRRIGDEGNGWYQSNVLIPFTADQLGSD